MPPPWRKLFDTRKLYQVFLHVAVIALTVEVVILAQENSRFKNRGAGIPMEQIKAGDYFSLDSLESLSGTGPIDTTSSSLIFVFTTTCPFCEQSLPYWKKLSELAQSVQLSVFGISLDDKKRTLEYIADTSFVYASYIPGDTKHYQLKNHIATVPQTIVRGHGGIIKAAWSGALNENTLAEVVKTISEIHITHN